MIIMKKIRMALSAIVMTYIFMIAPAFCFAGGIPQDKQMHIAASAAVETFMAHNKPFNSWAPWQRSLFNVVVIGGAKELYDSRHPDRHSADWGDIGADAIGAFGAEGMIWLVHKTW
jgi:hypothetical protein